MFKPLLLYINTNSRKGQIFIAFFIHLPDGAVTLEKGDGALECWNVEWQGCGRLPVNRFAVVSVISVCWPQGGFEVRRVK